MLRVRPVEKKLYVELQVTTKTRSGLVIVRKKQDWQEETVLAKVHAVGPGCTLEVDTSHGVGEVCVGDLILIPGHAGKWVDPELTADPRATFRIIDQEDAIAWVEEVLDGRGTSANESSGVPAGAGQVPA